MNKIKRDIAGWTRWLHIYLSMFSFGALLFFAITGITLNHPAWMDGRQKIKQVEGQLTLSWVHADSLRVEELKVVEHLRNNYNIKAYLSDFTNEATECAVSFKGPGYTADGFIDRSTGKLQLTITKSGFIAMMNDLHKGRDSGTTWAWLIDVSAVLMILVSLTGFIMIFYLKKRRFSGLIITVIGAMIILMFYYLFV